LGLTGRKWIYVGEMEFEIEGYGYKLTGKDTKGPTMIEIDK
jgi:hypothetical protein